MAAAAFNQRAEGETGIALFCAGRQTVAGRNPGCRKLTGRQARPHLPAFCFTEGNIIAADESTIHVNIYFEVAGGNISRFAQPHQRGFTETTAAKQSRVKSIIIFFSYPCRSGNTRAGSKRYGSGD